MSAAPHSRLKQPTGWFAAGHEVDDALRLLSDGAFRLFMWLCLHAGRSSGSVRARTSGITRILGRSEEQIAAALDELVCKRVCILYIDGVIEIADRFWPYRAPAVPRLSPICPVTSARSNVCSLNDAVFEVSLQPPTNSLWPNSTGRAFRSSMSNEPSCLAAYGSTPRCSTTAVEPRLRACTISATLSTKQERIFHLTTGATSPRRSACSSNAGKASETILPLRRNNAESGSTTHHSVSPRLTHVNNFRHHCKRQRHALRPYSHRVGIVHSHRRNTHTEPRRSDFWKNSGSGCRSSVRNLIRKRPAGRVRVVRARNPGQRGEGKPETYMFAECYTLAVQNPKSRIFFRSLAAKGQDQHHSRRVRREYQVCKMRYCPGLPIGRHQSRSPPGAGGSSGRIARAVLRRRAGESVARQDAPVACPEKRKASEVAEQETDAGTTR